MNILSRTESFVKKRLSCDATGHDYWHALRVLRLAERIGKNEGADLPVVRLAALLHDIADWKFHGGNLEKGPGLAAAWLKKAGAKPAVVDQVADIIRCVSFKGAGVRTPMKTLEGKVVQDADRLDALGAIGVARAFAYGGLKKRPLYDPAVKPIQHRSFKAYQGANGTTINHFYEKLLLLKDRMNTRTGRLLAKGRHAFMKAYLREFFREWK